MNILNSPNIGSKVQARNRRLIN